MAAASLPAPPDDEADAEGRRVWIGNIDAKITEFVLLKLVQRYGELEKFDFLYHKSGPVKGKPRGYCFVTYLTKQNAEKAEKSLNGKKALSKRLVVKPAHTEKYDLPEKNTATSLQIAGPTTVHRQNSTRSQIAAIESQLRQLEKVEQTDIDAFLPADKKQNQTNPLIHCIAGKNDSQNEVMSGSKVKGHSSSSHRSRDQRSYSKHKR